MEEMTLIRRPIMILFVWESIYINTSNLEPIADCFAVDFAKLVMYTTKRIVLTRDRNIDSNENYIIEISC